MFLKKDKIIIDKIYKKPVPCKKAIIFFIFSLSNKHINKENIPTKINLINPLNTINKYIDIYPYKITFLPKEYSTHLNKYLIG